VTDAFWKGVKRTWSQRERVSEDWLKIPTWLGGFGIESWDYSYPRNKLPKFDAPTFKFNIVPSYIEKLSSNFIIPITPDEASAIAQQRMASTVSADDVPQISSVLRAAYKATFKNYKYIKESNFEFRPREMKTLINAVQQVRNIEESSWKTRKSSAMLYGSERHASDEFRELSEIARIRKVTLSKLLPEHIPSMWNKLRELEGRGMRRWEAIDWLLGKVRTDTGDLHPKLSYIIESATVKSISTVCAFTSLRKFSELCLFVSHNLSTRFYDSTLSKNLFLW